MRWNEELLIKLSISTSQDYRSKRRPQTQRMYEWNKWNKNKKKYYYSSILNGAQGMDNIWNIQKLFLLTTCDCWASIPSHIDKKGKKKDLIYRNVLPADNPKPIYSLFPTDIFQLKLFQLIGTRNYYFAFGFIHFNVDLLLSLVCGYLVELIRFVFILFVFFPCFFFF